MAADRLGHTSNSVTLDPYNHVLPDMQQRAADAFGEPLFRT